MRPLLILSAILLTSATPVFAQVTVDLHALQALPDHPVESRPVRREPIVRHHPAVVAKQAPTAEPKAVEPKGAGPKGAGPTTAGPAGSTASAKPPAVQPTVPESVPATASIAPVAPAVPPPGAQPPAPPPVSDTSETKAVPTTSGVRLTFAPGDADLSPESTASIKKLTADVPLGDLTTFNVLAYAPGKADDPSTSRRVSLSRAMAVRSALVADGVPSARIFVRALGEKFGDGPPDRADISVMGANAPAGGSGGNAPSGGTDTSAPSGGTDTSAPSGAGASR
ncbi:MAG TPA: OmpA family protein [Rhodopila sp.]|nr:OmpA family protein [Rhodopila sp.]